MNSITYGIWEWINQPFPRWKREIQWENGLGGSGGYERIFGVQMHEFQAKNQKKIRFNLPNPPHPFSHRISTFQSGNYWISEYIDYQQVIKK